MNLNRNVLLVLQENDDKRRRTSEEPPAVRSLPLRPAGRITSSFCFQTSYRHRLPIQGGKIQGEGGETDWERCTLLS